MSIFEEYGDNSEAFLMSTHNMFLLRTGENYPRAIIKYPP